MLYTACSHAWPSSHFPCRIHLRHRLLIAPRTSTTLSRSLFSPTNSGQLAPASQECLATSLACKARENNSFNEQDSKGLTDGHSPTFCSTAMNSTTLEPPIQCSRTKFGLLHGWHAFAWIGGVRPHLRQCMSVIPYPILLSLRKVIMACNPL